jgi:hypothetical protein
MRNEKFRDLILKRRSSHMKGRVSRVKIVSDFREKEIRSALACSANLSRLGSKSGIGGQTAGHSIDVTIDDVSNEIEKTRLYLRHQSSM